MATQTPIPASSSRKIYRREWARRNPNSNRREQLRRRYGITLEQWNELLVGQAGRCAICSKAMRRPAVDHNHITGEIRGLLCNRCNGLAGTSVEILEKAIIYQGNHNARRH